MSAKGKSDSECGWQIDTERSDTSIPAKYFIAISPSQGGCPASLGRARPYTVVSPITDALGRVAPIASRVKRDPLRKFATAECGQRFHAETRRWPDRRSATPRGPQRLPRAVIDFSWTADRWPISASRPSLAFGTASIALFLIRPEVRSPLRSANARRRRCWPWVTTAELTQHNAS